MMRKELDQVETTYSRLNERFKGVNIVNDQINNWAKRVHQKFATFTSEPAF
jgi:hypothetical protein